MVALGIECWNGTKAQVESFKNATSPTVQYPLLLKGKDTQNAYGINYDWSVVIDRDGIIRYSDNGVQLSSIQNTIETLLASPIDDKLPQENDRFNLIGNFPNPFNPNTQIVFTLQKSQRIRLNIYTAQGRLIKTLFNGQLSAGNHTYLWNGTTAAGLPAASGVYYYELQGEGRKQVKSMILLR